MNEKSYSFQMARVHVSIPDQFLLLYDGKEINRKYFLEKSLAVLPRLETARTVWAIGNFNVVNNNSIYFRIGRMTRTALGKYVEGSYIDEEQDNAIYTHCVIDTNIGLCAIAKNYKVSPYISTIVNQLSKLINDSELAKDMKVSVKIKLIKDPKTFIDQVFEAYSVNKFWFTFKGSNPQDMDEDFYKPCQRAVDRLNGYEGRSTVYGRADLDRVEIEKLTNSAAAVGEDAGASILEREGTKTKKISLKDTPVTFMVDDVSSENGRFSIWQRMSERYAKLRKME